MSEHPKRRSSDGLFSDSRVRLIIQILGFAFMAGVMWWRVAVLETAVSKQGVQIEALQATLSATNIDVAKVKTIMDLVMRGRAPRLEDRLSGGLPENGANGRSH